MTKWIVGVLLLGNIALFGWMQWGSALTGNADTVSTQPVLNADKIRLLGMPASAPASAPVPVAPAIALTQAVAPAPAQAVVASASIPAAASAPAEPSSSARPNGASCAEWGEFSGNDLARSRQALATLNLGEKLSERSVEHKQGYWIYIPPLKKRADLHRKVAQLKERGITDYFVVQEKGKWLNAISLGVFKTKEGAEKYLATLRSRDVRSAKLGERLSKLKFIVFVMKGLDAETADKISALKKDFPDSDLKVSACAN